METQARTEFDVIVVGAGPVGLAAALLLEQYGLTGLVLDRRAGTSEHPKARGLRLRASELAALWGFDEPLRAIAMPADTHRFIYCETVAGEEIARTAAMESAEKGWSSVPPYRVPQDRLEAIMEKRVLRAGGIVLERGVTAVSVSEDPDGITVEIEDAAGTRSTRRARYLIAADGVGSALRGQLGIQFGTGAPTPYWHSLYWRGDLRELTADRPAIMYYTQTGGASLVGVAPAGGDDRWITIVQNPPSQERPAPLGNDEAVALIRRAVGRDDLAVDLVSSETFRISADVAGAYRSGRTFLAGDAAHSLPPTGGFGINTGFADIHNLVWKLAAVLRGIAPAALLDSYESERKPVAEANAAWSTTNSKRFVAIKQALIADDRDELRRLLADQQAHVDPVEQDLGFSYSPSDGSAPPAYASLAVGARAPHAPLEGGTGSTLSVLDGRYSLVVGSADSPWLAALDDELRPRLQVLVVGGAGFRGSGPELAERYPLGVTGAALVRPDGHVGWIARDAEGDLAARLRTAYGAVLGSGVAEAGV
ncbi:FAD-dependent oxidoreductase [soil metagenome]